MHAALGGEVVRIRALLAEGVADPGRANETGETVLMAAAISGSTEAVRLLLEAGADVDAASSKEWTALQYAVVRGPPDMVRLLLDAGASPFPLREGGPDPLLQARMENREDIARILHAARTGRPEDDPAYAFVTRARMPVGRTATRPSPASTPRSPTSSTTP